MKKIKLSQGQFALVDDYDYERLSKFKWYARYSKDLDQFYAQRTYTFNGKKMLMQMHRYITNAPTGLVVDHINHDTLDNRKCNLRVCTSAENLQNMGPRKDNKSGYKGVYWIKKYQKYQAHIRHKQKSYHLGYFDNPQEAYQARLAKERELGWFQSTLSTSYIHTPQVVSCDAPTLFDLLP